MRDMLLLLEAIRLEIRAAAEDIVAHILDEDSGCEAAMKIREDADKLSKMAFNNTNLANDEKEALGHE